MNQIKTLLLAIVLIAILPLKAQKLGKVTFAQDGNNVKIDYTMSNIQEGQLFDVEIFCSDDGGQTFDIKPKTITNTGQAIVLKNGKNTAIWTVRKDRNKLNGNNFVFKVTVRKSIAPQMVLVKGGSFTMGSNDEYSSEKPPHKVTLNDFYIGKYEVTIGEYMEFVNETKTNYPKWLEKGNSYNIYENGSNKDYYKKYVGNDNLPIVGVSWNNAIAYCKWLGKKTGKKYRLPTEAEWEYAAGGGANNRTKYAGTNSESKLKEYAWYYSNSDNKTHKVGQKKPNQLGLYDMTGNVWEWCQDKWHSNYKDAPNDGSAWESGTGSLRVNRGGSWSRNSDYCRVAGRSYNYSAYRNYDLGFRLALSH